MSLPPLRGSNVTTPRHPEVKRPNDQRPELKTLDVSCSRLRDLPCPSHRPWLRPLRRPPSATYSNVRDTVLPLHMKMLHLCQYRADTIPSSTPRQEQRQDAPSIVSLGTCVEDTALVFFVVAAASS
eukprot:190389-Amphidinium_carterae.1